MRIHRELTLSKEHVEKKVHSEKTDKSFNTQFPMRLPVKWDHGEEGIISEMLSCVLVCSTAVKYQF